MRGTHPMVRVNYAIRAGAFAYSFLVLALHAWDTRAGAVFWSLAALQFLLYPHIAFLRARRSEDQKQAEEANLYLDSALLAAWVAALQFPLWIAYGAFFSTTLNGAVVRGIPGALVSIACFAGGIAAWAALFDLGFAPQTSNVVTALCFFGSAAYCTAVGYVVYGLRRRLVAGRDALRASDARFRLIAEYAADLIAMVDDEGRWLYASPRYRALLPEHELEPGKDAFARMHPDDAQLARNAVQLAAASRKPREVELRFADRAGRIHRLKSRIEAIEERRGAPKRLVMVSRDMTDVLESEERVLLAAHALEGMTEAIVITAADGTVLTVNRAFTEITGYSREEVVGQNERVVRTALQPAEYFEEMLARARAEGSWSGSTWSRRKNGALYREWRSVRAVRDPGGEITHFVTVFYEASGREGGGAIPAVQT